MNSMNYRRLGGSGLKVSEISLGGRRTMKGDRNPLLSDSLAVNQIGYRTEDAKFVVFAGAGGRFRLIDESTGTAVWSGETGPEIRDASSRQTVFRGDFSAWRQPGTYRIVSDDGRRSPAFTIAGSVYGEAHRALFKAFYYFRCGMQLEEAFAGPWKHGPCHRQPAVVYGDETRRVDAAGGWHDAGDYGKYVGPGAKALRRT